MHAREASECACKSWKCSLRSAIAGNVRLCILRWSQSTMAIAIIFRIEGRKKKFHSGKFYVTRIISNIIIVRIIIRALCVRVFTYTGCFSIVFCQRFAKSFKQFFFQIFSSQQITSKVFIHLFLLHSLGTK